MFYSNIRKKTGYLSINSILLFLFFATFSYGKIDPETKKQKTTFSKPHQEAPFGTGSGAFGVGMILPLPSPINTEYADYAPVWHPQLQGLIFTSRRPRNPFYSKSELFEDIYIALFDSATQNYSRVHRFNPLSSSVHDAIVSVTPNGDLIFYRSDGNGDLFLAPFHSQKQTFGKPIPLSMLNSNYTETSAFWHKDQIYFVSNRPGGVGKRDIFIVKKQADGSWSDPVNLGPPINSEYDEESPLLSADGKILIFASNRPGGYGGFDLYISYLQSDGSWSKPLNLGPSLNTAGNDIYPYWLHYDQLLYSTDGLSSDHNMDIFIAYLIPDHIASLPSYPQLQIEQIEKTKAFLPNPQISFPFVQLQGEININEQELQYPITIEIIDNQTQEIVATTELTQSPRFLLSLLPNTTYLLRIQIGNRLGYLTSLHTSSQKVQTITIKKEKTKPIFTSL